MKHLNIDIITNIVHSCYREVFTQEASSTALYGQVIKKQLKVLCTIQSKQTSSTVYAVYPHVVLMLVGFY